MRGTPPRLIAGGYARYTTVPPPPWRKMREQAHLMKFKEFRLKDFPWTSSQMGLLGLKGGWAWADPKHQQAKKMIREGRWKEPNPPVRLTVDGLPPQPLRDEVPPLAKAVLAAHLRGRGGGYGLSAEQVNIPVTMRSQRPELDAARTDEPSTMRMRWAQYRSIELLVKVKDLGLSTMARRRLEALVPELIHEGTLRLECDHYEDFWDNYEWTHTKLLQITADARKADLHPEYWPMEQYKVRGPRGAARATESLRDWHTLQQESLRLGEKYCKLKEQGVDSVTGFQLYDTSAQDMVREEKRRLSRVQVTLHGREEGYTIDRVSAALQQKRAKAMEEGGWMDEGAEDDDDEADMEVPDLPDPLEAAEAAAAAAAAEAEEEAETAGGEAALEAQLDAQQKQFRAVRRQQQTGWDDGPKQYEGKKAKLRDRKPLTQEEKEEKVLEDLLSDFALPDDDDDDDLPDDDDD